MRVWTQAASALLMAALVCAGASAQGTEHAYGGRGEDRLLEMTQAGSGVFAVGMTASGDGDLSMRTRTGESGWALLTGEDGERIWSYASAHTGLARMICPAALEDGRYALVLTDEQMQRGEWLLLDNRGRLISRTPVTPQALGLDGEYTVLAYCQSGTDPASLTLIAQSAGDGMICAATIDESGAVHAGTPFVADREGRAASDLRGRLIWVCADEGDGLSAAWLDRDELTQTCGLSLSGNRVQKICDAMLLEDGSVVCCGGTEGGGFAARVSYEGEVLFTRLFDGEQSSLCQTETGFAVYGGDENTAQIAFLDEDGALLDTASSLPAGALDLCGAIEGAALLSYREGYRQKQAVITRVVQKNSLPIEEEPPEDTLPVENETGKSAIQPAYIGMADGYLICSSEGGSGVQVRCMAGDGQEIFCTRTPIHTAADALEWICAARLDGGSILLGGRYLFGAGEQQRQVGAVALLDGSGVLRGIRSIDEAGAVCGITCDGPEKVTLHAAKSGAPALEADLQIQLDISGI